MSRRGHQQLLISYSTGGPIVATGGTIVTDGDYNVHVFEAGTSSFIVSSGRGTADILVVGGGGGGGGTQATTQGAGGGGGGGVTPSLTYPIRRKTYSVVVGTGGVGGNPGAAGADGNDSSFDSVVIAYGGGGGAGNGGTGSDGSSGGGGSNGNSGGTGSDGFDGGAGSSSAPNYGGGGGGGDSEIGAAGTSTAGGDGGDGTSNGIHGIPSYFGGGGGGGTLTGGTAGVGGAGGGGDGGLGDASGSNAGNASTNILRGGGGGGAGSGASTRTGGSGGDGYCLVRYQARTLTSSVLWNSADATAGVSFPTSDKTANNFDSTYDCCRATSNALSSGKWYWEIKVDVLGTSGNAKLHLGVKRTADTISQGSDFRGTGTAALLGEQGNQWGVGAWSTGNSVDAYDEGDIVMCALDCDNGKFYMGKNGTWFFSANPGAGTGAHYTTATPMNDHAPFWGTRDLDGTARATIISDSVDFTYSVPSGFSALADA